MLELYNHVVSTCSQKVRLVLAEKGLDYEPHWINLLAGEQHTPAYVKLNPNHVVPTLVHDGKVLIESRLINEYLDDAFPERSLSPADPVQRHAMRLWTKRIDTVHPSAGVITFGIGTRPMILQKSADEIDAEIQAIPDAARRAARRSVIDHGVKAPEIKGAIHSFLSMLDDMAGDLEDSDYLVGDDFTLADAAVTPYVLRLDSLAMTPFIEARPPVARWFDRVRARGSYEAAITSLLPAPLLANVRAQGEAVWKDVEAIARDAV